MGFTDTERLDWLISRGTCPTMSSKGNWYVLVGDERGNEMIVGAGENPRAAIDSAMLKTPKCP